MSFINPDPFQNKKPGECLLGLDIGTKTIGLALSDTRLSVASPHLLIERVKYSKDIDIIKEVILEYKVCGLVFGLPLGMNGDDTPWTRKVCQLAAQIARDTNLPYAFWDERFSTAAAERTMIEEADLSRARRAELIDKASAAYMLQGFLDAR